MHPMHLSNMKLSAYLELTQTSDEDFGKRIKRNRSTVSRLRRGLIKPDWGTAAVIQKETEGAVTPNDYLADDAPSHIEATQ